MSISESWQHRIVAIRRREKVGIHCSVVAHHSQRPGMTGCHAIRSSLALSLFCLMPLVYAPLSAIRVWIYIPQSVIAQTPWLSCMLRTPPNHQKHFDFTSICLTSEGDGFMSRPAIIAITIISSTISIMPRFHYPLCRAIICLSNGLAPKSSESSFSAVGVVVSQLLQQTGGAP